MLAANSLSMGKASGRHRFPRASILSGQVVSGPLSRIHMHKDARQHRTPLQRKARQTSAPSACTGRVAAQSSFEFRFSDNFEVAYLEQQMIMRKLFEVEAAQLLEPDNRQTRIERVELADLDVGSVQIVRVVRQLG